PGRAGRAASRGPPRHPPRGRPRPGELRRAPGLAHPRTHAAILERPRRLALIAGLAGLAAGLVVLVAWPRAEKLPGHAYAIPAGADRVVVEVLNGSGRDGLARRVTRELRSRGLDVVNFGNEAAADSTLVVLRRGDEAGAAQVRGAL